MLLSGLKPEFSDFETHFLRDKLGVTNFIISMISLGATVFIIIAVFIYQYIKKAEVRFIFLMAALINTLSGFMTLALAERWNVPLGIPDGVLFWTTDIGFSSLNYVIV